jgi:phosphoserine phosphatase RsbU/P
MSELGPIDEYRDLFESAPCGYLTIGSDGRITKVNATLTAWTGFTLTSSWAGACINS